MDQSTWNQRKRQYAKLGGLGVFPFLFAMPLLAADIQRRADAPKPLTPEQSLQRFRLPADLDIELVASEPLLADPTAICFDATGRLFVCELHGYNLDGHLDIAELNKTGVLDHQVRRIPASPKALKEAEKETYGTVKVLTDTDGDGRMDHVDVWADRLPACYGIVAARDGLLVVCAPSILYLADRDGDGKAEIQKTLFTGFGVGELWTRINHPCWGIDNWIYVASGIGSNGTIRGPALPQPVRLANTGFRLQPDGSRLEPVSGSTSGFGLTMTDWGDRFLCSNQQHALLVASLAHRYLARNPYYAAPDLIRNICLYGHPAKLFPTSKPHPWRSQRSRDPDWVKFYGQAETGVGNYTSACSPLVYRGALLPQEYRGNHFSCEPSQNLVHRCLLLPEELGFSAKRAREDVEFLTSTDQWFRPTNLLTGPDGAIYIVDMYREIIEDYSAIPRYLQQQYGLIEGSRLGRLWRIVPKDRAQVRAARRRSTQFADAGLVAQLSNPNAWWRLAAQRLLIERGDKTVTGKLTDLAGHGKTPQARLHALYTLDGLNALDPDTVQNALDDDHFAVRLHALRLSERWLDERPRLLQKVFSRVDDPNAKVRMQLALTLGETRAEHALEILQKLAVRDSTDPWMQAALLSSVVESSPQLLRAILHSSEGMRARDLEAHARLLSGLASIVGARHQDEEIGSLLQTISSVPASKKGGHAKIQSACLTGLVAGLQRGKPRKLESVRGGRSLQQLLASPQGEIRSLALQVIGLVKLTDSPEVQTAFRSAAQEALDESQSIKARQAAIGLLASAPYATMVETADPLLHPSQPLDVQQSAVRALSAAEDPGVASVLLAHWSTFTPSVQATVIGAIFSRTNRLPALLDAIEQGVVSPQGLVALQRDQLLSHSNSDIARRAKALFSDQVPLENRELVQRYRLALAGPRDAQRGKAVFTRVCSQCHRLEDAGNAVGPDLSAVWNRADESLLLDLLQPSAKITAGYQSYIVVNTSGQVVTGVLASETATSITLRTAPVSTSGEKPEEVLESTILRKDIDEMLASQQSLMPDRLEKEVTPRDMADLIAYLRETLKSASSSMHTLEDVKRAKKSK